MKKRGLRFDRFLVFVFSMDRGDQKTFTAEEMTRGLTDHGPFTLSTIPIITRGSFHIVRPGLIASRCVPGDGGWNKLDSSTASGVSFVALEDDSEYHCVIPRESAPKFWDRSVFSVKTGERLYLLPGEYAYLAAGKLYDTPEKLIYNRSDRGRYYDAEENVVVAVMSLHDKPGLETRV